MAKLKKMLTHPRKNESGQGVLAIVLILLMLGAIILTPLLVFMSTGLKAGGVYESKMQEFYAADAGVEDAIWQINHNNTSVADFSLNNNRTINVTIGNVSGGGYSGYKIISTATSDSSGGNTTIECNYGALNYSSLLDSAITSDGDVTILGNKAKVSGNVTANGTIKGCDMVVNGTCNDSVQLDWPTAETLSEYYWVETLDPYPTTIYVEDTPSIGPLYREGDLYIDNTGGAGAVLNLTGTIYVKGNFECQQAGGKDYTMNLNNTTIYCEGNIVVSDSCTIIGSGCIIAVGDIEFKPKGDVGSEDDFVLIMSVEGTAKIEPTGNFYGAVAGNAAVNLQPNNVLVWRSYKGKGIDFPMGGQSMMKVLSYTIK